MENREAVFCDMKELPKKFGKRETGAVREIISAKHPALLDPASRKVTHEVGNLLNNVGLTLSTLKKESLSPRGKRAVAVLEKESKRVKLVVHNILQLAKNSEFHFAKQSMDSIIRDVVFVHESDAEKRGVRFALIWPPDLPPVHVDAQLMYQALINLVKNSLEAMTSPGDIVIKGSNDKDSLVIIIEDTGPGIAPGLVRQIFDPTFTTKGRQGTGLGLSIVEAILEAHSGTIECHSNLGKGTRFTLRLPQD
jgi:two-component system sensor histidine kinase HydH